MILILDRERTIKISIHLFVWLCGGQTFQHVHNASTASVRKSDGRTRKSDVVHRQLLHPPTTHNILCMAWRCFHRSCERCRGAKKSFAPNVLMHQQVDQKGPVWWRKTSGQPSKRMLQCASLLGSRGPNSRVVQKNSQSANWFLTGTVCSRNRFSASRIKPPGSASQPRPTGQSTGNG